MKELTSEKATDIMYSNFYKKYGIDKLPENMQYNVLDMVINSGSNGIKVLQKGIGAKADGVLGPRTLKNLKLVVLLTMIILRQENLSIIILFQKIKAKKFLLMVG